MYGSIAFTGLHAALSDALWRESMQNIFKRHFDERTIIGKCEHIAVLFDEQCRDWCDVMWTGERIGRSARMARIA